jgi:hypothetical protein
MTGRVVDAAGRPLAGVRIHLNYYGDSDASLNKHIFNKYIPLQVLHGPSDHPIGYPMKKTDADGKFRFEGLLPALEYDIQRVSAVEGEVGVSLTTRVSVESGKVKDLGDLKCKDSPKGKKEKEQ